MSTINYSIFEELAQSGQLIEINESTKGYIKRADKKRTGLPFDFIFRDEEDTNVGDIDIQPDGCYWRIQTPKRFVGTKIYSIQAVKTQNIQSKADDSLTRPTN